MSSYVLKAKWKALFTEAQVARIEKKRLQARRRTWDTLESERKEDALASIDKRMAVLTGRSRAYRSREMRATHLARMFLKGIPLERVEKFAYSPPDWPAVERMVATYSEADPRESLQRFEGWKADHVICTRLKRVQAPRVQLIDNRVYAEAIEEAAAILRRVGAIELSNAIQIGRAEPFFMLRGQDRLAPDALLAWIRAAEVAAVADYKIESARNVWELMMRWPGHKHYPD